MGAVVVVAVPRAGRAVAGVPGGCGDVSSVPREEQGALSPGGEGWLRGREGAQETHPALGSHRCAAPRGSHTALPGTVILPHPTDMEIPLAPVHGVTLSPQRADPWVPLSHSEPVPPPQSQPPPSSALTVDDDAEQEGDEEDQDDAHESHAEPGELAVGAVPPTHLCPELLAWRRGQRAELLSHAPFSQPGWFFPSACPLGANVSPSIPRAPLLQPHGQGVCTNPQGGTEAVPAWCGAGPILVRRMLHARCCPGLLALENGVAELGLWDSEREWHPGDPRGDTAAHQQHPHLYPALPCCRPEPRGTA